MNHKNGWYRSGTRTGQDAEMLAEYVDVIGPMFYPSHFEQTFLNYAPVADRTYRIYYYGSFRNTVLCRNRAIIRPWIQSFYLNVSYDRLYYDSDYIKKQFFGVRDSLDRGYMCRARICLQSPIIAVMIRKWEHVMDLTGEHIRKHVLIPSVQT